MFELNELEKRVLELNKQGMSQQEIADVLGYPTRSAIRGIMERLRYHGFSIISQRNNGHRIVAVNAMIKDGKTHAEIAEALGISRKTLAAWKYANKVRDRRMRPKPAEAKPKLPKWQSEYERMASDLRGLGTREIDWSRYPRFQDVVLKKRTNGV